MSDFYSGALAARPPPGAFAIGALELLAMVCACAVIAGPPVLIGLADLVRRWRTRQAGFRPEPTDVILVVLVLALGVQLAMVTVFAVKVAGVESETRRLWGRYFEFFAPMLWLAAGPVLTRRPSRSVALAASAVVVLGLAGLLAALNAGIVLLPWDSSVLTAFFRPDPVRAPLGVTTPYRAAATLATLGCAAALALRLSPARAGLALILALGLMSTWLDHVWIDPMVDARNALERDAEAIARKLPPPPAVVVLLAPDANNADLGFLRLNARPYVIVGPPGQAEAAALATTDTVVVAGPDRPPGGPWTLAYRGEQLSLWRRGGGG
ncbi:MAG TPA: hypothetical protein VGC92_01700 [Phenylobacterium sp.]|jgi:hypothetical protein